MERLTCQQPFPGGFCNPVYSEHPDYTPPQGSGAQSGCPPHPASSESLLPSPATRMVPFLQLSEQLQQAG